MNSSIHLYSGESGGIGKSTVCAAAISVLEAKECEFAIFDADYTKQDIYKAHKHLGCQLVRFSEAESLIDGANPIFDAAFDNVPTVLVNLPASNIIALSQWFSINEIPTLAKENQTHFLNWFLLDGSASSNTLLKRSIRHFDTSVMTHVACRNFGKTQHWELFDEDTELQELLAEYQAPVMDFPMFHGETQRQIIAEKNLSLHQAASYEGFKAIPRQRVKRFVRESAEAFASVGLLGGDDA